MSFESTAPCSRIMGQKNTKGIEDLLSIAGKQCVWSGHLRKIDGKGRRLWAGSLRQKQVECFFFFELK